MSRPPWWAGLAPAEARLDCGGQPHRLRWADGQLTTPDHTDDLEGEQILSALGGQGYPCLDVLDLWAQHAADLRVLILASRGPADPLPPWTPPPSSARGRYRAGSGFARGPRAVRARRYAMLSYGQPDDADDGLPRLIGIGGLLPDRLAATVIATWAERLRSPAGEDPADGAPAISGTSSPGTSSADAGRGGDGSAPSGTSSAGVAGGGDGPASSGSSALGTSSAGVAGAGAVTAAELAAARPALHAALYGRAVTALRSWTGRRDLAVALTMIPEGEPPRLARDGEGIAAELPFGWLTDVWARGLATCWGRFCLAAEPQPAGDGWLLSTVGPELDPPRPVTLSSPPG